VVRQRSPRIAYAFIDLLLREVSSVPQARAGEYRSAEMGIREIRVIEHRVF
jgi:hypothetical protein